MAVTYTNAVKDDRLQAVIDAIGAAGKLEIGSAGMAAVLATIPLANPAGTKLNGVLTLSMPQSDTSADNTGTAAAARIRKGDDTDVITGLVVGLTGSGAEVEMDSVSLTAGQTVTVSSGTITSS